MTRATHPGQQLFLCDFDGTLTKGDTFIRFLLFTVPLLPLLQGAFLVTFQFLWLIIRGEWSNAAGKAAVLAAFFQGDSAEDLSEKGAQFYNQKLPALLRSDLLESMRQAKSGGHLVVIVSASISIWLLPFCRAEGFDLLCTELEFSADGFTGQFATPNCNGQEKARRIQEAYVLDSFERIIAFGNSKGDEAMFGLAQEVYNLM